MKKLLTLVLIAIAFQSVAQVKISNLTAVSTPVGTDVLPVVNGGSTKKITLNQIRDYADSVNLFLADTVTMGTAMIVSGNDTGVIRVETDTVRLKGLFKFTNQPYCCRPYRSYVAIVTQSGTSAPTATVLENQLGGTVVFTYLGVGQYAMTLVGAFPINKSYCVQHQMAGSEDNADTKFLLYCKRNSDDAFLLETLDDSAANTNALLKEQFIEIRVYP